VLRRALRPLSVEDTAGEAARVCLRGISYLCAGCGGDRRVRRRRRIEKYSAAQDSDDHGKVLRRQQLHVLERDDDGIGTVSGGSPATGPSWIAPGHKKRAFDPLRSLRTNSRAGNLFNNKTPHPLFFISVDSKRLGTNHNSPQSFAFAGRRRPWRTTLSGTQVPRTPARPLKRKSGSWTPAFKRKFLHSIQY
jgi:hypothetical protein